jgi:hypothetical protein
VKINLLKKIILIALKITINQEEKRDLVLNRTVLTTINQEEKRDLVLNRTVLTTINQEEKRDLVLNRIVLKIEKNQKIHLN